MPVKASFFCIINHPTGTINKTIKIKGGKMKNKFCLIAILVVAAILVSCEPSAPPTTVPPSPQVQIPPATPTPEPTPTKEPTSVPRTEAIVFSSDRGQIDGLSLYLIDPVTLEITPIDTGTSAVLPRWSPDFLTIVFAVPDVWNLYTVNPDGSGLTQVTDFRSNNADWSPDGMQLVFQSDHDNEPENVPDIYTIDINGENLAEIQDVPPMLDFGPRWSPDGSRILFITQLPGFLAIFDVAPDGSGLHMLTGNQDGNIMAADWSPDASKVVYSLQSSKTTDLYVVDSDGTSNLMQLTDDEYGDEGPVFSPDGERIVFSSDRGGSWDLWTIKVDGTGLMQLTNDEAYDTYPDWRP
jgi:Tol biopolymer transport system component